MCRDSLLHSGMSRKEFVQREKVNRVTCLSNIFHVCIAAIIKEFMCITEWHIQWRIRPVITVMQSNGYYSNDLLRSLMNIPREPEDLKSKYEQCNKSHIFRFNRNFNTTVRSIRVSFYRISLYTSWNCLMSIYER